MSQPAAANSSAMPRPMPRLAPVISATLPASSVTFNPPPVCPNFHCADINFRFQRPVHRALVGDFEKPLALLGVEIAFERDGPVDVIDLAVFGFTFGAVGGVDLFVPQPDLRARERDLFEIGIEPHRHRGAGAERREKEIVGSEPAVEPAVFHRLIRQQAMFAADDLLLELAAPRLVHGNDARLGVFRQFRIVDGHVEIAIGPCRNHPRHIDGVAGAAEEVVGAGERDEAFGMLRRQKDMARIVDADGVVGRRMEDQQRLVQGTDALSQILLFGIVQKARRTLKGLPASVTSTSPLSPISGTRWPNKPITWAGSNGAAIVTTARASGMRCAAASTAAPPRLWPIRMAGAASVLPRDGRRRRPDRRRSRKSWCWRTRLRWRRAR